MIKDWIPTINNKIKEYLLSLEQPFWTVHYYDGRNYVMTFEYNIYEVGQ